MNLLGSAAYMGSETYTTEDSCHPKIVACCVVVSSQVKFLQKHQAFKKFQWEASKLFETMGRVSDSFVQCIVIVITNSELLSCFVPEIHFLLYHPNK